MSDMMIRENVNGLSVALSVCLALIFVMYLWQEARKPEPWRVWYRRQEVQGAIALLTYFAGEVIIRGGVWIGLRGANRGAYDASVLHPTAAIIGCLALAAGALCAIRVFSPDRWGHWPWVASAVFALASLLVAQAI